MNKTNTTESTLNMIKSVCAERNRKRQSVLRSNRLEMDRREEAEKERMQERNSIFNSYSEKAKAREDLHSQERGQMIQSIHDESMRRKSEDAYRSQGLTAAINRGIQKVKENENRNTVDAFIDRNKELLDKGKEAVKREQSMTYFG